MLGFQTQGLKLSISQNFQEIPQNFLGIFSKVIRVLTRLR